MINHVLAKLCGRPWEYKEVVPFAGVDLRECAGANLLYWNDVNRNFCVIPLAPVEGQVFDKPFIKLRKKVGPFCDLEGFLTSKCALRKEEEYQLLRLLLGRTFEAELPVALQATILIHYVPILRVAVGQTDHVQKRVTSYASVAGVGNRRTYKPDSTSVAPVDRLLAFGAAVVGLNLVIEFVGSQNNGSTIQVKAVLLTDGLEDGGTDRIGSIGRLREPKIGDDPHTQQIVAEITKRAVAEFGAYT